MKGFVEACTIFQQNKTSNLHPVGLLQPLALQTQIWANISMDFVEGLPKAGNKPVLVVIVD